MHTENKSVASTEFFANRIIRLLVLSKNMLFNSVIATNFLVVATETVGCTGIESEMIRWLQPIQWLLQLKILMNSVDPTTKSRRFGYIYQKK